MKTNWHNQYFVVFSDVHCGHSNTPTENILSNLKREVKDSIRNYHPKIIFISGDFFDKLLSLPSSPSMKIQGFIAWFLRECKKHSVALRVLEGTPSHDWKQNYLFMQINQDNKIEADVRYLDKLCIDTEESLGLNILYVPDEWDESTEETRRQVIALLSSKGLESVDLAIMHGMFEFQVPEHLRNSLPLHNQAAYEEFVEQLIVIGHDHRHKRNGKVVVPGSFDRIAHGEEDPKGYIIFKLKPKGKPDVIFVENKEAETYRSIDLTDIDLESSLEIIDTIVSSLPINAKVRLIYRSNSPLSTHLQDLSKKYASVIWSKPKIIKDEEVVKSIDEVVNTNYTAIILNKDNLEDKLLEYLNLDDGSVALARDMLRDTMRSIK